MRRSLCSARKRHRSARPARTFSLREVHVWSRCPAVICWAAAGGHAQPSCELTARTSCRQAQSGPALPSTPARLLRVDNLLEQVERLLPDPPRQVGLAPVHGGEPKLGAVAVRPLPVVRDGPENVPARAWEARQQPRELQRARLARLNVGGPPRTGRAGPFLTRPPAPPPPSPPRPRAGAPAGTPGGSRPSRRRRRSP